MLQKFGIETRLQLAITICVVTLMVVTTLGGSGGAAWVFLLYRTLLPTVAVLCAIAFRRTDERICPGFLFAAGTALLLMLMSVLLIEGSHFEGYYLWYKRAFFLIAFISFAHYARYQSARWKALLLAVPAILGIAHSLPDLFVTSRPFAGFSGNNPNYFATFLLIGFAGSLAVAVFGVNAQWRIAAVPAAAFLLFCILRTSSRGATLAAGFAVVIAAVRGGNRIPRQVWLLIGLAGLITAILASPFLVSKFLDRGERDPYNYARTQIWLNTLPVIAEYPFFGVGFGQFGNLSKRFAFPVEGQVARYLKRAQMAHNEYLQHIAEIGLPAALLLFSMFGYMIFLVLKRATRVWPDFRCFHEAALLTAAGVGLHALVDNCWTIPVTTSGLFVFGLGDVIPRRKRAAVREWGRHRLALAAAAAAAVYAHSVVIPGIALYYNEAGHAAFEKSEFDKAERLHLAALRVVPDHTLFLDNLGMVYLQRSADTRDSKFLVPAREYFEKAIQSSPHALDPHIHMEALLIRSVNGILENDRRVYRDLVTNNAALLEIDPYIPFPRKNLSVALYYLGERESALREMLKALEYEPNYVPGHLQVAGWYAEQGNVAESDRHTAIALGVVNKYREYKPVEAYVGVLLGRPEESWIALKGAR